MKNYIQPGNTLTLVAPSGDVVAGSFYLHSELFVCAATSADEGDEYEGDVVGVFSGTKKASETWVTGEQLFWNDSTKVFSNVSATGLFPVGVAAAAAASADATGAVRLDGIATVAVPAP